MGRKQKQTDRQLATITFDDLGLRERVIQKEKKTPKYSLVLHLLPLQASSSSCEPKIVHLADWVLELRVIDEELPDIAERRLCHVSTT